LTENLTNNLNKKQNFTPDRHGFHVFVFPVLAGVLFLLGLTLYRNNLPVEPKESVVSYECYDTNSVPKLNISALLMPDVFSSNLRDTIYTDDDIYLELRVDRQMVYVHYRDGDVKAYPVSTGNKYLSKSVESRPGLFAIFLKEELHLSSQFNDAKMFHYMPFNMGIGFHGLAGTGYYGNLGIRPSSHGCIRMRNDHVKELFKDCDIGTLVLVHFGNTARVIAFTPEGYTDSNDYDKTETMRILAYNLNSLYAGRYFIEPPRRFVINSEIIPRNGFNVGSSDNISEKQFIPVAVMRFPGKYDRFYSYTDPGKLNVLQSMDTALASYLGVEQTEETEDELNINVDEETVNRLAFNKAGILPYFPPNR
jgi:hypothetical protein